MTVSSRHVVEINECVVQISTRRMYIYMVHIALRSVEKDTFYVIYRLFDVLSQKPRPISGNLATAHRIRMICKVYKYDRFCAYFRDNQYKTESAFYYVFRRR